MPRRRQRRVLLGPHPVAFLDDDHAEPRARQAARDDRAARAGADDDDVYREREALAQLPSAKHVERRRGGRLVR